MIEINYYNNIAKKFGMGCSATKQSLGSSGLGLPLQSTERIFYSGGQIPKPETNTNYIRLYGHNLCPFASRARYALALAKIPFQDCQTEVHDKAEWMVKLNGGAVPILEFQNGEIMLESSVIA